MSRRALVTGATGMLGSHIVERLLLEGWEVRALVRDHAGAAWLQECGAELAVGRLEDGASLLGAAKGCDVIFHAAATIGAGGDWEAFRRGNVEGTRGVVDAATAAGARLVHVSSTAVFGQARYRCTPTDETVPVPELPAHDVYGRSKQGAEHIVLHAHRTGQTWTCVVRPAVMYGRRDRQFAPRVAPVLQRGIFPRIGGGRTTLALVHVGSVAEGAILAATCDAAAGLVFHLTNDFPVTVSDLVSCAAEGLERKIYAPDVPHRVGRAGFTALRVALRVLGRGDLARHARGTFDMLTRDNPFTSKRARDVLGWDPSVPPEVGLTEAFRWWNRHHSAARR